MEINDLDGLINAVDRGISHDYSMELNNLNSVERCIRYFESAITKLKYLREGLIREQMNVPQKSNKIITDSYDETYCDYNGAEAILGYKKGAIRLLVDSGEISYMQRGTGKRRHFIKAELYKYRDGIKLVKS
jgi:hypothetical protein